MRLRPARRPVMEVVRHSAHAPRMYGSPIIAIAASTGGPAALTRLLTDLKGTRAPILVVQHIAAELSGNLASWLCRVTGCHVAVAEHGSALVPGAVLVGAGGRHLTVDARDRIALMPATGDLHQPSADRLFDSLAAHAGRRTIAAVLTGMGSDGATGLRALRDAGAMTFAQDEASSAVFGMAKAAIELGAVRRVLPLDALGLAMARAARPASSTQRADA